ncbi:MAG: transcriptional regulator [Peptostreptococcaceae bacterium]|nr:transcriptional regulator [Peptostreptococcaceae bacterium]
MKPKDRFELYATLNLTTYHYKVILLLMTKELTQSQMANALEAKKQNIHSICHDLKSMDIIQEHSRIGNNVYLALNLQPQVQAKGQLNLF